jgi:hypothetical protein
MNIIRNYRYWVLALLGLTALLTLIASPDESLDGLGWLYVVLATKAMTISSLYLFCRLYRRWDRAGRIEELTQFVNEY